MASWEELSRGRFGKRLLEKFAEPCVKRIRCSPSRKRVLKDFAESCRKKSFRSLGYLPRGFVLTEPGESTFNDGLDNVDHDYICRVGDKINVPGSDVTYEILGGLGRGCFGQVLKCRSTTDSRPVALKITKHSKFLADDFAMEVREEARILGMMDHPRIVRMFGTFEHRGHFCIALELLGKSLLEELDRNGKPGLPITLIQSVSGQMLSALQYLAAVSIIHGDLKPENVMILDAGVWRSVLDTRGPQVKIIDFGAAQDCELGQDVVIQTAPYRAPEVFIGLPFTCAADMWSFGCIVAELFLGSSLFPHCAPDEEVLQCIEELLGKIPDHMLSGGRQVSRFYNKLLLPTCPPTNHVSRGQQRWAAARSMMTSLVQHFWSAHDNPDVRNGKCRFESRTVRRSGKSLKREISGARYEICWSHAMMARRLSPDSLADQSIRRWALLDLLRHALQKDPKRRWTARQACDHPFVVGTF